MCKNTCCFFGHKQIDESEELRQKLCGIIEDLIVNKNIDTFLFGSKSKFNSLCLETVSGLKEKYPHVKRVYVRAEYPFINEEYKDYLLESYEDTYYPEKIMNSGRAVYVERNCEMIDKSRFCVVYCSEVATLANRKSGTAIALDYALKKQKEIINLI